MTRPISLFSLALLLVILTVPAPAFSAGSGAFVAVYNSGRAQVQETRIATLPEGPAAVVFTDVPATLDPASVRAVAPGMTIRDIEYRYKAITPENLLDHFVGKELNVILPDPADANARILRKARLLSNMGRPIFSMGKEVYIGSYEAVLLPSMPKGFDQKPTLTLTTDNSTAGKKNVALHYLMGGLNWRADYTMTVNPEGTALDLEAWATVTNTSDYAFRKSDLRLVAGDVQRAQVRYEAAPRAKAMLAMDAGMAENVGGAVEESFSEYHVYTMGRAVTLPAQGSKQVGLFSASGVPVEQELVSRFHAGSGQRRGVSTQNVESALIFKNLTTASLGRPMPAGLVRVFMPTSDGNHLVAGETRIGHVAEGGEVRLVLGRSFDVTVERKQTSFEKVGKNAFEVSWAITVKNGKKIPQDLKLKDSIPGQWKILSADTEYSRIDSGTIEFDLKGLAPTVGTDGTVINYSVRIQY